MDLNVLKSKIEILFVQKKKSSNTFFRCFYTQLLISRGNTFFPTLEEARNLQAVLIYHRAINQAQK